MKTLNIEIPKGFEIDKKNSTFERIVFKEKVDLTKEINDFLYSLMKETICRINEDCSIITHYNKSDKWLVELNYKSNTLCISNNNIWYIIRKKYNINDKHLKDLIINWFNQYVNRKDITNLYISFY